MNTQNMSLGPVLGLITACNTNYLVIVFVIIKAVFCILFETFLLASSYKTQFET